MQTFWDRHKHATSRLYDSERDPRPDNPTNTRRSRKVSMRKFIPFCYKYRSRTRRSIQDRQSSKTSKQPSNGRGLAIKRQFKGENEGAIAIYWEHIQMYINSPWSALSAPSTNRQGEPRFVWCYSFFWPRLGEILCSFKTSNDWHYFCAKERRTPKGHLGKTYLEQGPQQALASTQICDRLWTWFQLSRTPPPASNPDPISEPWLLAAVFIDIS